MNAKHKLLVEDHRDPVDALYGTLELPDTTDSLLDELRGPGPAA